MRKLKKLANLTKQFVKEEYIPKNSEFKPVLVFHKDAIINVYNMGAAGFSEKSINKKQRKEKNQKHILL